MLLRVIFYFIMFIRESTTPLICICHTLFCRLETELNAKTKERDVCLERESSTKLSLQRMQNDLREAEERYRRLDSKVSSIVARFFDENFIFCCTTANYIFALV